jgi:hypothetical protein
MTRVNTYVGKWNVKFDMVFFGCRTDIVCYIETREYSMKTNRPLTIKIATVALALLTGFILIGCASIGEGKADAQEEESSQQIDEQESAVAESNGSSAEAGQEIAVSAGISGDESQVQEARHKAGESWFQPLTASLAQALGRIFPNTLSGMNWNRIATVLVGLLIMSMIYGLAFAIGRLPLRRRRAEVGGGGRNSGGPAGDTVPQ